IERFGGLERLSAATADIPATRSKDREDFADYYRAYARAAPIMMVPPDVLERRSTAAQPTPGVWACTGPITYKRWRGYTARHCKSAPAALEASDVEVEEAFLPLAAPASVEASIANRYYRTDEEYLTALADALRQDYEAVIDAGFVLQID